MGIRIIGLSGNVRLPSRTSALVAEVLARASVRIPGETQHIDLGDVAPDLLSALNADTLRSRGRAVVDAVEQADALIVGSPVYRASYTGALKHLFDLVDRESLAGKPVIVLATGGTPMHGLALEHEFRPLFAFFKALVVPTSVYALESDFAEYRLVNADVSERIDQAVAELVHVLPASLALRAERAASVYRINTGSRLRAL